ncbi:hypothetical protein CP978_15250 [Streptomyces nodosus]|uniref:Uncharacterized protein n=1 Tax=Streptomyces nodosus TaxID=40318 RepID=A0A5P2W244_9ACTN|nr:hypothetical protein CP978_15250 [Streptomyces nodosus]
MRHTVRRLPWRVEQAGSKARRALRAGRIAESGAATGAAPGWLGLGTARTPHKVPEPPADSGL